VMIHVLSVNGNRSFKMYMIIDKGVCVVVLIYKKKGSSLLVWMLVEPVASLQTPKQEM